MPSLSGIPPLHSFVDFSQFGVEDAANSFIQESEKSFLSLVATASPKVCPRYCLMVHGFIFIILEAYLG